MKDIVFFDVEIYENYFLASFMELRSGKVREYEAFDGHPLDVSSVRSILNRFTIVTFNGDRFDRLLISAACAGLPIPRLKKLSDAIIGDNMMPWVGELVFNFKLIPYKGIDLINVAPLSASLKVYGGRMHSKNLQDLPIEPSALITPEDREGLRKYCRNDLITTSDLFHELTPQLKIREGISIKCMSKSDAQIAEYIVKQKIPTAKRPVKAKWDFEYQAPDNITFKSDELKSLLKFYNSYIFEVAATGHTVPLTIPDVKIGETVYSVGIGGIHSKEKSIEHIRGDGVLTDWDVAAYYPNIILHNNYYPEHIGPKFVDVYRDIVDTRLAAKKSGDKVTDVMYKIVINGLFGKFGSKWSAFYSPKMLASVTITGQLSLLMLIERLTLAGITVVSGNTDGILIKNDQTPEIVNVIKEWEHDTEFEMESTEYGRVNFQNCNNYVAIKLDGSVKGKGAYVDRQNDRGVCWSNPSCDILATAVHKYLRDNTPVSQTIRECTDIRQFIALRKVTGGAEKSGQFLGKTVRWYYGGSDLTPITYVKNDNKVPKTDGAMPIMTLPESFPTDVNFGWYEKEALRNLKLLGVKV